MQNSVSITIYKHVQINYHTTTYTQCTAFTHSLVFKRSPERVSSCPESEIGNINKQKDAHDNQKVPHLEGLLEKWDNY